MLVFRNLLEILSPEQLEFGTLTDLEIDVLAQNIRNNIEGITIFGEAEMLQSMIILNSIDLVRLYNTYLEMYKTSLYTDVFEEWYWQINQDLADTLKLKFINLHLNI